MRGHRTAGLDQLGPNRYQSKMVFNERQFPGGNKWSIKSRAAISTKKRKVKITLAERA